MANKKELEQTKGTVKLRGHVVGLENENTYREGVTKKGDGVPYRTASLTFKTSPINIIYNGDVFGQEFEKAKVYSNKNGEKKNLEITFKERHNIPEGFTPFGFGTVSLSFDKDDKGKYVRKNLFSYDAVGKIKETLKEGQSVWASLEFNPNTYTGNDGNEKTTVKYSLQAIGIMKDDIDFESENFAEVASFEQEFVVVNVDLDKEAKKVYVTGRLIDYKKNWNDILFVVDGNNYQTLAGNVNKLFKFGDLVKVQGKIVNGVVLEEKPKDPDAFDWGGETPTGVNSFVKNPISELQITNVVSHDKKYYKEDDFFIDTQNPFGDDNEQSDPFASDSDENPFS